MGGVDIKKQYAMLQRIDGDRPITRETDWEFLQQLQKALLLALKELGMLNAMQLRQAEEKLEQQKRDRARKKQERL